MKVQLASTNDRPGLKALLSPTAALQRAFPRMALIWLDQGYVSKALAEWAKDTLGWKLQVVRRPPTRVWVHEDDPPPPPRPKGFHVLKRRWVVERTFGWLNTYRLLAKEYTQLPAVSEAQIYAAMCRLMLRRLVKKPEGKEGHTGDSRGSEP